VARIVEQAGAGWVVDSSQPERLPERVAQILADPADIERRGRASLTYAQRHFTRPGFAERFDEVLRSVSPREPQAVAA
jgi:UDP-N-acetylglucosamine:LPS N-acetylglucosamine transferase